MNKFLFANNAKGTAKFVVNPGDTSMTLNTGQGALFPNPGTLECFRATLIDALGNIEIVEVTARAGDVFTTMQRGMEGTIPVTLAVNDRVSCRVTKEILEFLRDSGGFMTGDYRLTMRTAAATGWLLMNDGTIGSATSGADHASADAQNLYTLLWNNVSDTYAPVTGGRGANAAADWAANKKMALTKILGRALCIAGSGSGLTARTLGQTLGEELHVLIAAELAVHGHQVIGTTSGQSADHSHSVDGKANNGANGPLDGADPFAGFNTNGSSNDHTHSFNVTSQNAGSGSGHNNMQPSGFVNMEIRL